MKYYRVPLIGTGREDDPIRPNVPADKRWVGKPSADGLSYVIAVPDDQPLTLVVGAVELLDAALDTAARTSGLDPVKVRRWRVVG